MRKKREKNKVEIEDKVEDKDEVKDEVKKVWYTKGDIEIYSLNDHVVNSIIFKSASLQKISETFDQFYNVAHIPAGHDEPMMNILCHYEKGNWYLKIIPRKKHRPSIYSAPETEQVRMSPACIDLTGLLVIPFPEDFQRITPEILQTGFDEVCLVDSEFEALIQSFITTIHG